MTDTKEIEFSILIDQDGDFVVDTDADNLGSRYEDEVTSTPPNASRVFTFKLTVPLPKPTVVSAVVPDKGDEPVNITIS